MSKEMTPKESIQIIQDNLTPRTLGILTVEFNVVKNALDHLEQLEIADRNNQNLVKTNVELVNKNLELQKENQWLKELIKEYKRLKELANQVIEKFQIGNKNLTEENEKYKKVIAWLKNTFEITLDSKVRISDGTDCIQAFPIDLKTNEVIYDLLKEVLESV